MLLIAMAMLHSDFCYKYPHLVSHRKKSKHCQLVVFNLGAHQLQANEREGERMAECGVKEGGRIIKCDTHSGMELVSRHGYS